IRQCATTNPPAPSRRPSFPEAYPRHLVRTTDLGLASLEEVIPELRDRMNSPPRASTPTGRVRTRAAVQPPTPTPIKPTITRREAVLKALCEAAASKIHSGAKAGPYLTFIATAVAEAGFKVPSTSELRELHNRIGP
ncbi:MAG TPA: hypothetical protein VM580_22505, partial [Labilithrix sp.]|nr:hypothetical protein [Labilithrix sp.]